MVSTGGVGDTGSCSMAISSGRSVSTSAGAVHSVSGKMICSLDIG